MNRASGLIGRRDTEALCLHHVNTQQEGGHPQYRKWTLTRNWNSWTCKLIEQFVSALWVKFPGRKYGVWYCRYYSSTSYWLFGIVEDCPAPNSLAILQQVVYSAWFNCLLQFVGCIHTTFSLLNSDTLRLMVIPTAILCHLLTCIPKCKVKHKTMRRVHHDMSCSYLTEFMRHNRLEIKLSIPFNCIYQNNFLLTSRILWRLVLVQISSENSSIEYIWEANYSIEPNFPASRLWEINF